jgi:kynureninase
MHKCRIMTYNLKFENSLEYARKLDAADPLKEYRDQFFIPQSEKGKVVYLCGNSLGLQPKSVSSFVRQELSDWATLGVEGHVKARNPWVTYHKMFSKPLAALTGAYPHEVVAMNSLTTNLHLMLSVFYRPDKTRFKIITEAGSFSSDIYALESQVKLHGLDPAQCIIEVAPRTEEYLIREEDILKAIATHGSQLCLVLIGGVNYYTGQAFDMKAITRAAHRAGAFAAFDLAHAIGNIALNLHLWEVDFAVWCSYKYLNSGPGGVGGLFIHEKHGRNKKFPRLAGWWANEEDSRFLMHREFMPAAGAEGFQLSNVPVLSMAAHKASLDIFESAGIKNIINKGRALTSYLEYLIKTHCHATTFETYNARYDISSITPENAEARGSQLSLYIAANGEKLYDRLMRDGFIVDWRSPSVIRITPVPLYNTFEEVYCLAKLLAGICCHI